MCLDAPPLGCQGDVSEDLPVQQASESVHHVVAVAAPLELHSSSWSCAQMSAVQVSVGNCLEFVKYLQTSRRAHSGTAYTTTCHGNWADKSMRKIIILVTLELKCQE